MNSAFLDAIKLALPPSSLRTGDAADLAAFGVDRTRVFSPAPSAVLFPRSTEDVVRIVQLARSHRQSLVPSGGRTGYAGGAVASRGEVVVAFDRMNHLVGFDPWMPALTVEAGMTTLQVQEEASARHLYFPVDFASAGSSHIGGNLATHAGGIRVLRYGTIRRYVTGLTAVAGTGEVLRFPGTILKNNTGYDLKELLIGSEGTLALITQATLRLVPPPPETTVALLSLSSIEAVLDCLGLLRKQGLDLYAFEVFDRSCLELVAAHRGQPSPFALPFEWVVLVEFASTEDSTALEAFDQPDGPQIAEILPAMTSSAARSFWSLREGISEALSLQGVPLHKNDVSLPPGAFPTFLAEARLLAARECAGSRLFFFGHAADGNIHLNLLAPPGWPEPRFREAMARFDIGSYGLIASLGGSISAEHGIGLLKREALSFTRSSAELRLMREIKRAFDPDGILNPGKLLPEE